MNIALWIVQILLAVAFGLIRSPGVYLQIMPKRLQLERHLSREELERRYRQAREPVERSHYQIIWLLAQGKLTREVAEVTGYSPVWIGEIARRYNRSGPQGLGDRRRTNPGGSQRALLDARQREELGEALSSPPPGGGMWTSRKVAEWIGERTGRQVGPQRGWEYLRLLGHTPQVPRPVHAKADPVAQAEFRKNSLGG